MKKVDIKLILGSIGMILCIISMIILVSVTKGKFQKIENSPNKQRIIIVDSQTQDTIINRNLDSFTPMELDKLTKYLNER